MTGIAFTPFETRVETIVRLARQAETLDLAHVGVAEAWTHDATILLAELAAQTSRIGLGTGARAGSGCESQFASAAAAWRR